MSEQKGRLRQPVVVILGHVDSGKCVSGDTPIQLADGRIVQARKVFEAFKTGAPIERPDGVTYAAEGLSLLSVDETGRAAPRPASYVWKLHADRLIEVQTKAGYSVKTTPEHKFLVMLPSGEVGYREAGKLGIGDSVLVPSRTFVRQNDLGEVKGAILAGLSDGFLLGVSPGFNEKVRRIAAGRVKGIGHRLGDRNFEDLHRKRRIWPTVFRELAKTLRLTPAEAYDAIVELKLASGERHGGRARRPISLPKNNEGFEALAYIVGLLYGDGVAGSAYLSNTSLHLISEFRKSLDKAFAVGASEAWRRTSYIVAHRGGKTLSTFLHEAFEYPLRDKTRTLDVPELVSMMPDFLVAAFLRGFFDAEGFVQEGRNIGVGCESTMLMKGLPMLLQRFGCLAYAGKRTHGHEIIISGKTFVSAFNREVGFREPRKREAALERERHAETNRVFELTPIPGRFLKSVREGREVVWDPHYQLTSFDP